MTYIKLKTEFEAHLIALAMDQQSADFVVKVASFKQVLTTFSMTIIAFSRWPLPCLSAKL
ncbi:hypothetical protein N473_00190 [Pseudoalteromonas luteoviolacea CPMOR-1]|uniref:Uncharacterized protein n=1 Tax=Pseudoalteromonas luteoviolacea CPMOR-1 TaxID=1365248 RepID=A0A162B9G3_9GAMM|nr:hypothetical protein N473_00190 [Pseudoalteromonas luteoviolacea CPMOR-1]